MREAPLHLQKLTRRKTLRADFLWPDKRITGEYDSDAGHLESQQRCNDSTKTIALREMGFTVFPFTRLQIDDMALMDETVAALRKCLGLRKELGLPATPW